MRERNIAVLGAGTGGLASSLALAREGHRVTLIERDPIAFTPAGESVAWERKGLAHFLQPHAFIPAGRNVMRSEFPDVYDALIEAGARDIDVGRRAPGVARLADDDLHYLAVRRPVIEWGLRRAVLSQAGIEIRPLTHVRGLRFSGGRVAGVEVDGGSADFDLVVDALGRTSKLRDHMRPHGYHAPEPERGPCGVVYYSRYYRVRPGRALPDGPWILSPRGDLGYMGFASFPGDNGTFAVLLAAPTGIASFKMLRYESVFEAAAARVPLVRMWTDPEVSEPIQPVLPMGGLQNTLYSDAATLPPGCFAVADTLCHTDPQFALGLSFSLLHAVELARALRETDDLRDASICYAAAVMPALRERFDLAVSTDEQRLRLWTGLPVDPTRRWPDYALFSTMTAGAVAMVDPDVFRVFVRRTGLLDSTRVLDEDEALQERIEARFREMIAKPRPAMGPDREEMLAVMREAAPDSGTADGGD